MTRATLNPTQNQLRRRNFLNCTAATALTLSTGCGSDSTFTQASASGYPIRLANRAYLLTHRFKGSSRNYRSGALMDLWAFDATTAKLIYQSHLKDLADGISLNARILGLHNKTIWLFLPSGLHAANCDSGTLIADPERISYLNPNLRGVLPTGIDSYSFTQSGLALKSNHGETWHLHPDTLIATKTPPLLTGPIAIAPPYNSIQTTHTFLDRQFTTPTQWIGLLTPAEAITLEKYRSIGGLDFQSRRKLFSADITPTNNDFGANLRYSNFKPLTEDFLAPGIFVPITSNNPDSLFILHKDSLGDNGKLHLARFATPGGKILWNTPLNITNLTTVMPDNNSLLLYGEDPDKENQNEQLIAINLKTGNILSHFLLP